MKNKRMRPLMEDYTSSSDNQQNTPSQTSTRPQPKVPHYSQNQMQTPQTPSNTTRVTTTYETQPEEEEPIFKTSQAHKIPEKDYKINPKVIPRPNHFDEIYKNADKEPYYETSEENHPPNAATYFITRETQNSSCRFIRSSLTKIPIDQSVLNSSQLMFGLYLQPFAEQHESETPIPVVEIDKQIFRCRRCSSYINSKYTVAYSKANRPVVVCNLCSCENELDMSKPGIKNEYFNSNTSEVPELSVPTVDFIAPDNIKHTVPFIPHYLLLIDISQMSYDYGLSSYVINSLFSSIDFTHNAENSYIAIATYDHKSIQFFGIEKNNEIKVYIVGDIENPFCPLPRNKMYLNVKQERDSIDKLVEKITWYMGEKNNEYAEKKPSPGSVSGAAIAAGVDSLMDNGGRVMIFTANACLNGFGKCRPREDNKLMNTMNEKDLYIPQHSALSKLGDTCNNKRIAVDQFVFATTTFDLPTFSTISNSTGGQAKFYNCNMKDMSDVKFKLEKLHYDLARVLSRPNYYDVKFMLRYSIGIDSQEILGPFNRKLGEGFQVAACDPDYSFCYNLRLSEGLKNNQPYHFQIVCLYIDNFNQRYLRVFNYSLISTSDISKIYSSADVDTMTKITLLKELSICYQQGVALARENLFNKIINSFYYYRMHCSRSTPLAQLILPASIKYYPLQINAFIKKPLMRRNKVGVNSNQLIEQMNSLLRQPLNLTMKQLTPKLFRIDDIQSDQTRKFKGSEQEYALYDVGLENEKLKIITKPFLLPLSKDNIDFFCAYLIDDGQFINIYVFEHIEPEFYQQMFNVNSWDEAVAENIDSLDESNESDLNVRILNIVNQLRVENDGNTQPVRVFFLSTSTLHHPELSCHLIEDKTRDEPHYVDFLCSLHGKIQDKMNS